MADYIFNVDPQQLTDAAKQFDTCRTNCTNRVKTMMNTCTGLRGKWTGDAATTYFNKLRDIQGDLNDVNNIINEHVKDLNNVAAKYKQVNDDAKGAVSTLNPDVLQF